MRIYLWSALRVMVFQVGDLRVGIFLATEGHRGTKRDKGTDNLRDTFEEQCPQRH